MFNHHRHARTLSLKLPRHRYHHRRRRRRRYYCASASFGVSLLGFFPKNKNWSLSVVPVVAAVEMVVIAEQGRAARPQFILLGHRHRHPHPRRRRCCCCCYSHSLLRVFLRRYCCCSHSRLRMILKHSMFVVFMDGCCKFETQDGVISHSKFFVFVSFCSLYRKPTHESAPE